MDYVAGFCLDVTGRVALVRKARPEWQAGLLNAVGGKVEPGESAAAAMRREFVEEAGVELVWDHIVELVFPGGRVDFFRCLVDPEVMDRVSTCTDEPIEVLHIDDVSRHDVVANLRWLLPFAAHASSDYELVTVREPSPA
jgi:8-oxo-dGTP diphosphatase